MGLGDKAAKHGKAPGLDKVTIMLIKDSVDLICKFLTIILKASLQKSISLTSGTGEEAPPLLSNQMLKVKRTTVGLSR